eukprot:TRINITY_DN5216_c0_g1_i5.p2 TRINITY_DN5216_c0_g1~~TRINITY_DN5216_c0_g1_i5.p2  ORF type:complete len:134 (+),score=4.57 TRINITY_DN5216_c0_g1_i5:50-451(+)
MSHYTVLYLNLIRLTRKWHGAACLVYICHNRLTFRLTGFCLPFPLCAYQSKDTLKVLIYYGLLKYDVINSTFQPCDKIQYSLSVNYFHFCLRYFMSESKPLKEYARSITLLTLSHERHLFSVNEGLYVDFNSH